MKRTHKLKGLSDVAGVVAAAPNLMIAARRLGVNRSTLYRWLKAGKVQGPAPKSGLAAGARTDQTPDAWAQAVREAGELDVTQDVLVDLAAAALVLARTAEQPALRLAAMGRYQLLVKQLNLTVESLGGSQTSPAEARQPITPRRASGIDPRAALRAVK